MSKLQILNVLVIPEVLATTGLYCDMGTESKYILSIQREKRVLLLLTNTTYDYEHAYC
jgi:hypothetical protein